MERPRAPGTAPHPRRCNRPARDAVARRNPLSPGTHLGHGGGVGGRDRGCAGPQRPHDPRQPGRQRIRGPTQMPSQRSSRPNGKGTPSPRLRKRRRQAGRSSTSCPRWRLPCRRRGPPAARTATPTSTNCPRRSRQRRRQPPRRPPRRRVWRRSRRRSRNAARDPPRGEGPHQDHLDEIHFRWTLEQNKGPPARTCPGDTTVASPSNRMSCAFVMARNTRGEWGRSCSASLVITHRSLDRSKAPQGSRDARGPAATVPSQSEPGDRTASSRGGH